MSSILDDLGITLSAGSNADHRVVRATAVNVSVDMATFEVQRPDGSIGEAQCPKTEWYPDRQWQVGESFFMVETDGGNRPQLSVIRNELLAALLAGVSPEVRSGEVRIMGIVRLPGVRAKVAVASTREGLDPVAACVGRKANRVRTVGAALAKEQVDIVAWHADPQQYLINAMAPAHVLSVDITGRAATAWAHPHQMQAAIGRGGLNTSLAGRLVGLRVTVAER